MDWWQTFLLGATFYFTWQISKKLDWVCLNIKGMQDVSDKRHQELLDEIDALRTKVKALESKDNPYSQSYSNSKPNDW